MQQQQLLLKHQDERIENLKLQIQQQQKEIESQRIHVQQLQNEKNMISEQISNQIDTEVKTLYLNGLQIQNSLRKIQRIPLAHKFTEKKM